MGVAGNTFVRAGRARALGVVACAGAVIVASACTNPWRPRTTTTTTTRPPSTVTLDNVNYRAQYNEAKAAGHLPWFCHSEGLGGNMDHGEAGAGGLANDAYRGLTKGDLSDSDCSQLAGMFDQIIPGLRAFKTRGDAKKAGSVQAVQFVVGLGTHDSVPSYTRMGLPPGPPMFLQYDGSADSAPLAGISWFTTGSNSGPPEGFPGKNDWWHTHTTLCYATKDGSRQVVGNEISDADCQAKGGMNIRLPNIFMSHAWIIPGYEDRYDVFAGAYMCLKGEGKPPAANDPCHDDHSDPEHAGSHDMTSMTTTTRPGGAVTTVTTMPPMDHSH
jgi:hypothetical protein